MKLTKLLVPGFLLFGAGCSTPAVAPPVTLQTTAPAPAADPVLEPEPEPVLPPLPTEVTAEAKAFFSTLPSAFESEHNPLTESKITLGRMLFFENRMSKNHDVSCNSCHGLDTFGVDGKTTSNGHKRQRGDRNSPTVYNAGAHIAQFWDGRAADLEAQAKGPILNPVEMAMVDESTVVAILKSIPGYRKLFKQAFPADKDPITYDNLALAIGAFERKLVTPGKFDRYLAGDETALSVDEKRGMAKFAGVGCTTCHNGAAVGGSSFQKLGLVEAWVGVTDEGRFKVTKAEEDKQRFRVPSLRNIAETDPYLHDGSETNLNQLIRKMAKHQLGRELADADVVDIEVFLKALTGVIPVAYIAVPTLPKSGPKTPKPDPS
ncbi:MAG: cytochrome c peroxidase [Deltaproteobacteria bacterium]|nr:cytochrome c peroxidase [Deltaproteobacteria bacterium]